MNNHTQNTLNEYESLKNKNRRRLIGAGAITLLVGGLFAAIASNAPQEDADMPESASTAHVQMADTETEVLRPKGLGGNQAVEVVNPNHAAKSSNPNNAQGLTADEMAAEPDNATYDAPARINSAEIVARAQRESAQQLAQMAAPAPLSNQQVNANLVNDETQLTAAEKRRQQRIAAEKRRIERQKQREEAAKKREQERRERELAKQKAERERLAKAREDEARRRKAQAIADKAEAEREARRKAAAEQARQAQLMADKARQAEREKLLAQQQAANRAQIKAAAAADAKKNNTASETVKDNGKVALVQVGTFRDKALAQQAQQKVRALGYGVQMDEITTSKGKMYRVRTTNFANKTAAVQAATKIKTRGLAALVIEQK